jgi:hypothetical protein
MFDKKEYMKEYYQRPDVKKRQKEYYQKNKKYIKEYQQKNKDIIKEYQKEYYQRPYVKEYYQQPDIKKRKKEYDKEYRQRSDIKKRQKEYNKEYNQRPSIKKRKKKYMKKYNIKHNYGILLEEFKFYLEKQENKCAICSHTFTPEDKICIDHDHATGKVRGLLCFKCNVLLGMAVDNSKTLMNAIKYLNEYNQIAEL